MSDGWRLEAGGGGQTSDGILRPVPSGSNLQPPVSSPLILTCAMSTASTTSNIRPRDRLRRRRVAASHRGAPAPRVTRSALRQSAWRADRQVIRTSRARLSGAQVLEPRELDARSRQHSSIGDPFGCSSRRRCELIDSLLTAAEAKARSRRLSTSRRTIATRLPVRTKLSTSMRTVLRHESRSSAAQCPSIWTGSRRRMPRIPAALQPRCSSRACRCSNSV